MFQFKTQSIFILFLSGCVATVLTYKMFYSDAISEIDTMPNTQGDTNQSLGVESPSEEENKDNGDDEEYRKTIESIRERNRRFNELIKNPKYALPEGYSRDYKPYYEFSIIDRVIAEAAAASSIEWVLEHNKKRNPRDINLYEYDEDCLRDFYQRQGFFSSSVMNLCMQMERQGTQFSNELLETCYFDLMVPLANDPSIFTHAYSYEEAVVATRNDSPCWIYLNRD